MEQNLIEWIKTLKPSAKSDMVKLMNWIERQPDSKRLLDTFFYGSDEEFEKAFKEILK